MLQLYMLLLKMGGLTSPWIQHDVETQGFTEAQTVKWMYNVILIN